MALKLQKGVEALSKKSWDALYLAGAEKKWGLIDPHIPTIARLLKRRSARRVLDLGCGSGRHLVYLAQRGIWMYGIDLSLVGIQKAKQRLARRGISANLEVGSVYRPLPYRDDSFDAVICIRALNHGRIKDIRQAISELYRVLKPGGILFITVRKRIAEKLRHPIKEIAPHTYVPLQGREKGLVHYFFTKQLLRKEFKKFTIQRLWVDKDNYYCLLGEKK